MDEMSLLPFTTPLKRIKHPKGDVFHAMKASDPGFAGFGEAYLTTVHFGDTKGWKAHTRMHMNLVVPVGRVKFYLHETQSKTTTVHEISEENYVRLTVPPGIWMAFSGAGEGLNLVLNLASIEHDPEEALNVPLETYKLEASA